ncbi:MAG TPA: hypothetical protein VGL56_14260 [Fimbriimonadaceae bacterium]
MTGLFLTLALFSHSSSTVSDAYLADAAAPQKLVFTTSAGSVDVYLPRQVVYGEIVSGSAFANPGGSDWNSQHAAYDWLSHLYVRVGAAKFPVSHAMLEFQVPSGNELPIDIEDSAGTVYSSYNLAVADRLSGDVTGNTGPKVVQAGGSVELRGHFDGDREHTYASINGHEVGILAEGSDCCYVTIPADWRGPQRLRVHQKGTTIEEQVNAVGFNFMAPSQAVLSGKKSSIGVEVDGLQNADPSIFPVEVELSVDNPDVLHFEGPDKAHFMLTINKSDVVDGHVVKGVPVKAHDGGSYHIRGRIFSAG